MKNFGNHKKEKKSRYTFKFATESEEWSQIRELNYLTFVEEIPQHDSNEFHLLIDRFEEESSFFICRCGKDVVGMLALRSNRPFSLDAKLPKLDSHIPSHRSACEIRLLAIIPEHRNGRVLAGLIRMVYEFFETRGHDLALISGTLRQARLYRHMGFVPFGPMVGTENAMYQPMYQFVDEFRRRAIELDALVFSHIVHSEVNLMPGPIFLDSGVKAAMTAKPLSHRSPGFKQLLNQTQRMLCDLTHASYAVIAMGSGTLANDLVAGQLAQIPGRGLILNNGEFGRRLVDHATRMGLNFDTLVLPWGEDFDKKSLRLALARGGKKTWLWAVHAETSTGVLNDIELLKQFSSKENLTLCLDCISSLGVVPCDLRGVTFASGVSGKGLRCMAGLALVFHNRDLPVPSQRLPRYLDLQLYQDDGVPFTLPSNLVTALKCCLEALDTDIRYKAVSKLSHWLAGELKNAGINLIAEKNVRFPGILTFSIPKHLDSHKIGDTLHQLGWLLNYESEYLLKRNCLQIALLGHLTRKDLEPLPCILAHLINGEEE